MSNHISKRKREQKRVCRNGTRLESESTDGIQCIIVPDSPLYSVLPPHSPQIGGRSGIAQILQADGASRKPGHAILHLPCGRRRTREYTYKQ